MTFFRPSDVARDTHVVQILTKTDSYRAMAAIATRPASAMPVAS